MRLLLYILILIIISCKEKPNYNPFDDQFDVSVSALTTNGVDTVSAGCGYFNLIQKKQNFRTYYQVFIEDYDEVVAKGFAYNIDTIALVNRKPHDYSSSFMDSIYNLPFDEVKFEKEIQKFGFQNVGKKENSIIIRSKELDTIKLNIYGFYWTENTIIRSINYYKSKEYNLF